MAIMVLLVGATIPVLSPPGDERKLREASRGINTFLSGAQARAVQTGRPVGVMFRRLSEQTGDVDDRAVCLELVYVAEAAPYAGLELSSRVMISRPNPNQQVVVLRFVASQTDSRAAGTPGLPEGLQGDLLPPETFAPGDLIEIGGVRYQLLSRQSSGYGNSDPSTDSDGDGLFDDEFFVPPTATPPLIAAQPVDAASADFAYVYDGSGRLLTDVRFVSGAISDGPYWTEPKRYRIRRQPLAGVTAVSAPPYQLPEGMAIDLRASGVDGVGFPNDVVAFGTSGEALPPLEGVLFHRDENPLADKVSNDLGPIVMFAPSGVVDRAIVGVDANAQNGVDDPDLRRAFTVSDAVYLCIGLRENIPAPGPEAGYFAQFSNNNELEAAKAEFNWLNGDSRWVIISGFSGSVVTAPNGFVNPASLADRNPNLDGQFHLQRDLEIFAARQFAADRSKEGGQ